MKKTDKEKVVAVIKEKLNRSRGVIISDYCGMDVAAVNDLRKKLKPAQAEFRVLKNNLVKRAITDYPGKDLELYLTGPTAFTFVLGDSQKAAKIITDFVKENKNLKIKGAYLEGKKFNDKELKILAGLPSREVCLAKLAGVLKSPLANLVYILRAPLQKLVLDLKAIKKD